MSLQTASGTAELQRILVPTSVGPNTVHTFSFLLPLTPHIEVTALYVAPDYLGENEEALGHARLRQTLDFIDAGDRIRTKVITTTSVINGIVTEALQDYDMVMIGASLTWATLDTYPAADESVPAAGSCETPWCGGARVVACGQILASL